MAKMFKITLKRIPNEVPRQYQQTTDTIRGWLARELRTADFTVKRTNDWPGALPGTRIQTFAILVNGVERATVVDEDQPAETADRILTVESSDIEHNGDLIRFNNTLEHALRLAGIEFTPIMTVCTMSYHGLTQLAVSAKQAGRALKVATDLLFTNCALLES